MIELTKTKISKNEYQPDYEVLPGDVLSYERALGMPADYWLNLESQYQEFQARLAEEDQLVEVLRFLGIASVDQWDDVWPSLKIAYRKHGTHEVYPEALSAWLRRGEIEASAIQCESYDKANFRNALDEVRGLTRQSPHIFVPAMQELCAAAGVAVVFVPSLPKTCVSGATRWVSANKAVIQISLRYKTDDHLWFTFFHEAGHILLHGKKELFLEGTNGLDVEKENEANIFAENELIPKKEFSQFIDNRAFTKVSIREFARSIGIAPGIVVGNLQHNKKLLRVDYCNDLKQRFEWHIK